MNGVYEDRKWWLSLHFNLRRLLSGKKINWRDFHMCKIRENILIDWMRRSDLAILGVNILDLDANLVACFNSYSRDTIKKDLQSSYHEHICRKNWAKPSHVGKNMTEVEMPGQNRLQYRSFLGYCQEFWDV